MKVIGVNFHKNHNRQSLEKQAPLQPTNKDLKQISRNGMLPYLPDMDKMPYFIPVMTKFVPSFKGDYFENEYTKKVKNKQLCFFAGKCSGRSLRDKLGKTI